MSNNNNRINISRAREAMDRLKMLIRQEVGVNLQSDYNGHLTSRKAGSVDGQIVKKMCPERTAEYTRNSRIATGHTQTMEYKTTITI